MVLQNKRPNTKNSRLLNSQHSLVVRVMDCKTEGAVSIPDGLATVFASIRRLPKNHSRFFAITFYGSSGRVPPRTISKGFYLEPLKVPAER